ncbi:glucose 1-dehydrogenase [Natronorubrum sp. FCH18a]|uniref:glucose 1-dehydrogenase n=1 Tax=Natronorubrum sp. FCH18a TaxID=3447018 RepID=UPI003F51252F
MQSITGAVVVVTGGGSGIGKQTALAFADRGAHVVIGDVNTDSGVETVETIRSNGGKARFVDTDVTDDDDVEMLVQTAVDEFGGLDIAFNNAGIADSRTLVENKSIDDWQRVVDVNLSGVFRCMKHELEAMQETGDGTGAIVNNASVTGHVGVEAASAYVSAKHGVVGLTKAAALEYAETGIRVNAVCPGFIDNAVTTDSETGRDDEHDEVIDRHPIGRLGKTTEIAEAVLWVSSDDASFVTGETINVDGGYLAR